jgi:hypothetical protein
MVKATTATCGPPKPLLNPLVGDCIERAYNRRRRHSAIAMLSSPGQTIPLPDPAGSRNMALGTGIRRRCQLRPRHPLTRGPLSNRPQGRSSQPGTEEPGVTARHAAAVPTVPPGIKTQLAGWTRISMNSGNREILKLTALRVLSRLGWHHTGSPNRVMP